MDINLNFSAQVMSNFPGNISNTSVENKVGLFQGELVSLENIEEESKDIDYNLLLNLLSNIKILNSQENMKSLEGENTGQVSIEEEINKVIDLNDIMSLNSIFENVKKMDVDLEHINSALDKFIKNNNDINRLPNEPISNIELEENQLNYDEISLLKNLKDNLKSGSLEENKRGNTLIEDNSNLLGGTDELNTIKQVEKDSKKYKELEVSSLSNKINIFEKSEFNKVDKDLDALESILNGDDNNNLIFTNNTNLNNTSSVNNTENQPATNIRQEFIGEDIVKTVRYLKSNDLEEITIKISPKELGDMTIKLIKNQEDAKVSITISKEEVFDLVNENIVEITKHLKDLNINVKEVTVDIKLDNQKFFSDNLNKEFNKKNQQEHEKKGKYESSKVDDLEEIKVEDDNLNILI